MDPRIRLLRHALENRPARTVPRTHGLAESAVALVLRPAAEDLELLFIKRAEHEREPWSGHMALPGGRRNPADPDLVATALRETEEETAVARRFTTFIGSLDEVAPGNPRLPRIVVAPFLVCVPPATPAKPASHEVTATVWIPLAALREPGAVNELLVEFEGTSRPYPSLRYGEYVIWGLTYRILGQFFEVLESVGL